MKWAPLPSGVDKRRLVQRSDGRHKERERAEMSAIFDVSWPNDLSKGPVQFRPQQKYGDRIMRGMKRGCCEANLVCLSAEDLAVLSRSLVVNQTHLRVIRLVCHKMVTTNKYYTALMARAHNVASVLQDVHVCRRLCVSLSSVISHSQCLARLEIGCNLGPEGWDMLGAAIGTNTSITTLCLNNSSLGDQGLQFLSKGLSRNASINNLMLDACLLTDIGGAILAKILWAQGCRRGTVMWQVSLRHADAPRRRRTRLRRKGSNKPPTEASPEADAMAGEGARDGLLCQRAPPPPQTEEEEALARELECHGGKGLVTVSASDNWFTDRTALLLSNALRLDTGVQLLCLQRNCFTRAGVQSFEQTMLGNLRLRCVDVRGKKGDKRALLDAARRRTADASFSSLTGGALLSDSRLMSLELPASPGSLGPATSGPARGGGATQQPVEGRGLDAGIRHMSTDAGGEESKTLAALPDDESRKPDGNDGGGGHDSGVSGMEARRGGEGSKGHEAAKAETVARREEAAGRAKTGTSTGSHDLSHRVLVKGEDGGQGTGQGRHASSSSQGSQASPMGRAGRDHRGWHGGGGAKGGKGNLEGAQGARAEHGRLQGDGEGPGKEEGDKEALLQDNQKLRAQLAALTGWLSQNANVIKQGGELHMEWASSPAPPARRIQKRRTSRGKKIKASSSNRRGKGHLHSRNLSAPPPKWHGVGGGVLDAPPLHRRPPPSTLADADMRPVAHPSAGIRPEAAVGSSYPKPRPHGRQLSMDDWLRHQQALSRAAADGNHAVRQAASQAPRQSHDGGDGRHAWWDGSDQDVPAEGPRPSWVPAPPVAGPYFPAGPPLYSAGGGYAGTASSHSLPAPHSRSYVSELTAVLLDIEASMNRSAESEACAGVVNSVMTQLQDRFQIHDR
eukprot:jgi/Mesvir1/19640/Mv09924-RA.1